MDKRPISEQVVSGLWLAAKTLLAIFTGGALAGGLAILRRQRLSFPGSLADRRTFIPLAAVIVATGILIPTIKRWVTVLPGILGYATMGGLIMLATGHYGKMHVPRLVALALTLFAIASSALTLSFTRRPLTLIDRIALLVFVYSLAFSMTIDMLAMSVALGIGFAFLLFAWAVDRILRSRDEMAAYRRLHGSAAHGSVRH